MAAGNWFFTRARRYPAELFHTLASSAACTTLTAALRTVGPICIAAVRAAPWISMPALPRLGSNVACRRASTDAGAR